MAAKRLSRREFLKAAGLGAAGLAVAGLAAGLGSQATLSREPVELRLASVEGEVPAAVVERFNRQFAPYHLTRVDFDEARLAETLAGGTAPDVAALPALRLSWLAGQGVLARLGTLFNASPTARRARLFPVDGYFTAQDERWGLALTWSPDYLVWTNPALWEQAGVALPKEPLSLYAWRELSSRLASVGVFGTDFTIDFPALLWLAQTLNQPASVFSADGKRLDLHSSADFVGLARFVLEWKKEGGIPFRRSLDPLKAYLPDCT